MSIAVLQGIGGGAVLVGTTALGRTYALRYIARPRELRRLSALLRALATDIGYTRRPLAEALRRASAQAGSPSALTALFATAARRLEEPGVTAEQAWQEAMHSHLRDTALTAEDREILAVLGQTVGLSGPDEQVGHVQAALALLETRESEALEDRERYVRVFQTLGVLAGALIVILLI